MNKTSIIILLTVILIGGASYYVFAPKDENDTEPVAETSLEEHADQKADLIAVVTESIVGTWQSTDDTKFVREFRANGVSVDFYDGKVSSTDRWKAFTSEQPLPTYAPLEAQTPYIQLMTEDNTALNFKVSKLTPETLELIYLDRGGQLNFTRIK